MGDRDAWILDHGLGMEFLFLEVETRVVVVMEVAQ